MLVSDSLRRKADFMRLIKEPMSRDWVEKDRLLKLEMCSPCCGSFLVHSRRFSITLVLVQISGRRSATARFGVLQGCHCLQVLAGSPRGHPGACEELRADHWQVEIPFAGFPRMTCHVMEYLRDFKGMRDEGCIYIF